MRYTVKQLAKVAGVTVRTLHYYDEIGLLAPTVYGENGYRYYGEEAVLRLQQILFFRELDFTLQEIQDVLDRPEFDVVQALEAHKQALSLKAKRLDNLIQTIDKTILHMKGQVPMSTKDMFKGFDEETEKRYEQEATQLYGEATVKASYKRWNSYTKEEKERIKEEGGEVYTDLVEQMEKGPESPEVQAILVRWHQHLRYFYEPTVEVLQGLGDTYYEHPEFNAFFTAIHPDLPAFLQKAIRYYCQELLIPA